MSTVDPKLVSLATRLRPDLAQRLVVTKATQAGRGILLKPTRGAPMPARPPLPSMPDATAARVAVMQKVLPGAAVAPQALAVEAYVEEGARAGASRAASPDRFGANLADRHGSAGLEPMGRPIPWAIASLPPRSEDLGEFGSGRERAGRARDRGRSAPGDAGSTVRPVKLALAVFSVALVAALAALGLRFL